MEWKVHLTVYGLLSHQKQIAVGFLFTVYIKSGSICKQAAILTHQVSTVA